MSTGVVVGASGGIGAACARALAGTVERMILCGRRSDELGLIAAKISPTPILAIGDIATQSGRSAIRDLIVAPIDWLVLASGVPLRTPLRDATEAEIRATFEANLVAPAILIHALLQIPWSPTGVITVVGSISATRALPNRATYGASKAGLEHLARSLAAETGTTGPRVNVVAPGVIETPFLGEGRDPIIRWADDRVPLGRLGSPEEIASVVRYMTVDAPSYVNGARIAVDGGAEAFG